MVVPFQPLAPLAVKAEGWDVSFIVSQLFGGKAYLMPILGLVVLRSLLHRGCELA